MAGGDISITFQEWLVAFKGSLVVSQSCQTRPELVNKAVAVIRGPKVWLRVHCTDISAFFFFDVRLARALGPFW